MIYINARAIIERLTERGVEIVIQNRSRPHRGIKELELPGGRIEEYESWVDALVREVYEETGLNVVHIHGAETRVEATRSDARIECLQPFAVFQTLEGPIDATGVYFRCTATGELLHEGDNTEEIRWVPVQQVAEWVRRNPDQFSLDLAGIIYYLRYIGELK
jgi:8-oxo-dGTP pyrophosphatase MutT (NUDIX family)